MPLADMPQANKQHAVPQNIMDVEFKLIGDLTIRQFAYLMACGGTAYAATVLDLGIFRWPIVIFFVLLGVGLAFVPIQERGLDEWLVNFFRAIYSPTLRIWRKEPQIPSAFVRDNLSVVRQELITLAPTSSRRKLEEYLEYQSKTEKIDPLDIPEREYARKVREAYAAVTANDALVGAYDNTSSGVSVAVDEPIISNIPYLPDDSNQVPSTNPIQEPKDSSGDTSTGISADLVTTPVPAVGTTSGVVSEIPVMPVPNMQDVPPIKTTTASQSESLVPVQPQVKTHQRHTQPQQQYQTREGAVMPKAKHYQLGRTSSLSPMTPDMHAGRRFTNLVPKSSGELILPIRGEHTLRTSDQLQIEDDINDKAEKLQQLLAQIRGGNQDTSPKVQVKDNNQYPRSRDVTDIEKEISVPATMEALQVAPKPISTPAPVYEAPAANMSVDTQAQILADKLRVENERITKQLSDLQVDDAKSISDTDMRKKEEMILKLKTEQQRTQSDFEALQKQLLDLQNKLKEKEQEVPVGSTVKPVYARIQPLTNKPNVASGIVRVADGTVMEGILLIIKNSKNEAVRAFKSNTLGQFVLTTPLQNGVYTIEVSTNNKGLTFDIISLEAKGEVIPPVEIIGRSA